MVETISGYAALFNRETTIGTYFREQIARGAFARSLERSPDVVALLSHDSGRVLGRVSAGTLTVREDRIGLWFSLDVDPSTPEGQTALGTVGRRDVKGCSFGFQVLAEEWAESDSRLPLRTLTEIELYEITLTAFPAYPETTAVLDSADHAAHNHSNAKRRLIEKLEAAHRLRGF